MLLNNLILCREVFWKAKWPIMMLKLPFLSDKQTREKRKLTTVCLTIWCVLTSFCSWNRTPSDVNSYLFHTITSKEEEMISSLPFELRHYSNLSQHIKKSQNAIYCLNVLKKDTIWKLTLCFIPKVTCSVLSASPFFLRDVFFTVWVHDVWRERTLACWI